MKTLAYLIGFLRFLSTLALLTEPAVVSIWAVRLIKNRLRRKGMAQSRQKLNEPKNSVHFPLFLMNRNLIRIVILAVAKRINDWPSYNNSSLE